MIISASYRTDIPAFYGDWFLARLREGMVRVRNPYNARQVSEIALTPEAVDGFVFWTRNVTPFLPVLEEVAARGFPFVVQHTVLGYPRSLDRAVVAPERAVAALHRVAERFGPASVVWRYDPVVFSSLTPPDWHRDAFGRLADAMAGATDEVVASLLQVYRKTARNMAAAAARHGFTWDDPPEAAKAALLRDLSALAADNGLRLTLCGQPALAAMADLPESACVDAGRLSTIAGRPLAALNRPHRKTCACAESRDIGAYDTCPHGCAYCYAVRSPDLGRIHHKAHDVGASWL
ncbi:DUF1848 domain-containing protein [Caenispirillum bisanense]|uniref:DNA repair photolyase n=1 Tax=Caenispirillum bisanense TaxID=414052 RepID=A0A286GJC1_9PROT|nr:DUF1848 domain-containing protein [Caenispirillum bisanense]SOD95627.1 protein of unknown function [Caenispirillum bisanense]